jgi:DNA-binding transcriptional LysR family regulator
MKREALLSKFEVFLAVAKQLSITQAAKQLGLAKTAVSRDIRTLEEQFKTPLFIRTTRKIELTDEGRLLAEQCKRLQSELDTTRHLISGMHEEPHGTLRILSSEYFVKNYLLETIEAYLKQFPQVTLELMLEERVPDMEKENIDLVFGMTLAPSLDVVAKKISTTRYVICASPEYLKQYGTPTTIADLKHHQYIPHLARGENNLLMNLKKPTSATPNIRLKTNSAELMRELALRGQAIVQLHEYSIKNELTEGTLIELLPHCLVPKIDVMVYYQKHRYVQPKIRQFLNCLNAQGIA